MERGPGHAQDSDEQLVDALAAGDSRALSTLWDRHARPAYSLALRMLRDPGWAEEVVQDVFLRLWRNPAAYDATRGDLRRWLLSVAHHAAVDGLRGRRGSARSRDAGPGPLEGMGREEEDPADAAWANLRAERVRAAISQLPPTQREVIELAYFGGWSQSEIAKNTGQPLGTVKSRLRMGMKKLRASLDDTGAAE